MCRVTAVVLPVKKKRGGGPSEMDRHAARSQCCWIHILGFSSGNARTRWRACPGFPQTKRPVASAMPASSVGYLAWQTSHCPDPSGISWCIGLETVRTVVAAPSSISLSLSLSTIERKMWLIYQPIVATNILVAVITSWT